MPEKCGLGTVHAQACSRQLRAYEFNITLAGSTSATRRDEVIERDCLGAPALKQRLALYSAVGIGGDLSAARSTGAAHLPEKQRLAGACVEACIRPSRGSGRLRAAFQSCSMRVKHTARGQCKKFLRGPGVPHFLFTHKLWAAGNECTGQKKSSQCKARIEAYLILKRCSVFGMNNGELAMRSGKPSTNTKKRVPAEAGTQARASARSAQQCARDPRELLRLLPPNAGFRAVVAFADRAVCADRAMSPRPRRRSTRVRLSNSFVSLFPASPYVAYEQMSTNRSCRERSTCK
jgi:hypothetical protein